MRAIFSYWGAKNTLRKTILSLIPENYNAYIECFAGSAAVFWAKKPSVPEVLNDTNDFVIALYKSVIHHREELEEALKDVLYSEYHFKLAKEIYFSKEKHSDIIKAQAFYIGTALSMNGNLFSGFSLWTSSPRNHPKQLQIQKAHLLSEEVQRRLENVSILSRDAVRVVEKYGVNSKAFIYADPPYFNADMGHYGGYSEEDFKNLLDAFSKVKCKFLLSSYPSDMLTEYIEKYNWRCKNIDMLLTPSNKSDKMKTEVLTANYPLNSTAELF